MGVLASLRDFKDACVAFMPTFVMGHRSATKTLAKHTFESLMLFSNNLSVKLHIHPWKQCLSRWTFSHPPEITSSYECTDTKTKAARLHGGHVGNWTQKKGLTTHFPRNCPLESNRDITAKL